MGRPSGTKNTMRTPEEKEKIVLEYLNGRVGYRVVAEKYNISHGLFSKWLKEYREEGIAGFESKTGKHNNPNSGRYNRHPTEIEQLKKQLLDKEIEIERLKKGYQVKGVGDQKEYVTTFDANTK